MIRKWRQNTKLCKLLCDVIILSELNILQKTSRDTSFEQTLQLSTKFMWNWNFKNSISKSVSKMSNTWSAQSATAIPRNFITFQQHRVLETCLILSQKQRTHTTKYFWWPIIDSRRYERFTISTTLNIALWLISKSDVSWTGTSLSLEWSSACMCACRW